MHRDPHRPRRGTAALLGLALVALGIAAVSGPADAVTYAEGIDVSHWQGTIDWSQVAGARKRFAFLKASQGTAYRDPMYATNRSGANGVGMPIGAYHFADVTYDPDRPSDLSGARAEADWFVSVAQPRAGDLPPVFDIEKDNGLGPQALTDWTMAWLERVRQLTGIYTMVYTSPGGWNDRFVGPTSSPGNIIPQSGYSLLWVAHWTTNSSPTVPANNWAGTGWTFWQYTSDGKVPGISGRVDLDRYKSSDVSPLLLRQLTITKSSVDGRTGGVKQDGLGGFCGGTCTAATRLSVGGATTTLAPQSADATTTWVFGGDCAGAPIGGTCQLTMDVPHSVTITYVPTTAPITVVGAGTGTGSVTSTPAGISCASTAAVTTGTCTASFAYGSSVTLAATPTAGFALASWSGGGCTGNGTCVVTADAAKTITATFQPASYALTVGRSGTGTGTTSAATAGGVAAQSCSGTSCTWTYPTGTSVPLTAVADAGSRFVGWSGVCTGTGACAPSMTADHSVTAIYAAVVSRTLTPSTAVALPSIRKGQYATFTGVLGSANTTACPIGNQTVALYASGGTSALATAKTTSGGAYTFSRRMGTVGTFTFVVRAADVLPATLGNTICGAAASATFTITVT